MHDGSLFASGSTNKAQDKMKFDERFENEVIRTHVLKHSNMKPVEYDALARVEYYMLPQDALEHGFIDEIVEDIDTILWKKRAFGPAFPFTILKISDIIDTNYE